MKEDKKILTDGELFSHLATGGKIRRKSWKQGKFIFLDQAGELKSTDPLIDSGSVFYFNDSHNWEKFLPEENMTMVQYLDSNGHVHRVMEGSKADILHRERGHARIKIKGHNREVLWEKY